MTIEHDAISRRAAMTFGLAAAGLVGLGSGEAAAQDAPDHADKLISEDQSGDSNLPTERLTFNPVALMRDVLGATKASYEPRIPSFNSALLTTLRTEFIGKSRTKNKAEITQYLELFNLPFSSNGSLVPFCAAGLSYAAALAYARQKGGATTLTALRSMLGDVDHHHFYPTPSVIDMMYVARGTRRWVARSEAVGALAPKPGWLVVYNWDQDGKPDHVGIVESFAAPNLHTIEFNTSDTNNSNGGTVAARIRPLNAQVQGFIRPELVRNI